MFPSTGVLKWATCTVVAESTSLTSYWPKQRTWTGPRNLERYFYLLTEYKKKKKCWLDVSPVKEKHIKEGKQISTQHWCPFHQECPFFHFF